MPIRNARMGFVSLHELGIEVEIYQYDGNNKIQSGSAEHSADDILYKDSGSIVKIRTKG